MLRGGICTFLVILMVVVVVCLDAQLCLKCRPGTAVTQRCCSRFGMCCSVVSRPSLMQDSQGQVMVSVEDTGKNGKCPVDRFPNADATVCLRKSCERDFQCFGPQKCCRYGNRKCCVYPLLPPLS